jgi:hypothetical protein
MNHTRHCPACGSTDVRRSDEKRQEAGGEIGRRPLWFRWSMKSPEGLEPIHTRITRFEIATAGAFCDFLSDSGSAASGLPHPARLMLRLKSLRRIGPGGSGSSHRPGYPRTFGVHTFLPGSGTMTDSQLRPQPAEGLKGGGHKSLRRMGQRGAVHPSTWPPPIKVYLYVRVCQVSAVLCLTVRPQPAERLRRGWTHIVAEDGQKGGTPAHRFGHPKLECASALTCSQVSAVLCLTLRPPTKDNPMRFRVSFREYVGHECLSLEVGTPPTSATSAGATTMRGC